MKSIMFAVLTLFFLGQFVNQAWAEPQTDEKGSIEGIKREGKELLRAMEKYGEQQKAKAVEMADKNLDRLDKRIAALEVRLSERWDELSQESRTKIRAQLANLHAQRVEVAEWFGSLKRGSADAWIDIKLGFSDAFEDLSSAWERAESAFSDSE